MLEVRSELLFPNRGPRFHPVSSMAVDGGFNSVFSRVQEAVELSPLDHAAAMELETWEVGGNSGTIAGFKGKKVTPVKRRPWGVTNRSKSRRRRRRAGRSRSFYDRREAGPHRVYCSALSRLRSKRAFVSRRHSGVRAYDSCVMS